MPPRERCLRLLWILLLVPMLGVLGMDLPRLHHDREEAFDRPPPEPLHGTRRESSRLAPAPLAKCAPTKSGSAPIVFDLELEGAALFKLGRMRQVHTQWRSAARPAWHPRGPPPAATV